MKTSIRLFIFLFFFTISVGAVSNQAAAQRAVSFQAFYDDLSPHGSWFESPAHGYVWRPRLTGFTPYSTNGYWVLADVGWTWVSDYSWGWAPFHYGRWYNDPFYGYVWVPGYEWGPGWVTWRRSNDYYGWAPIGPGVNINVAYGNGYNLPYNQWNFVRCNDFGRRDIRNHYIDRSQNVTIINNTTVINNTKVDATRNTTYSPGPDRVEVQRRIGKKLQPIAIVDNDKPTQRLTKNGVQLYRPLIKDTENATTKPAPAKIATRSDVDQNGAVRPQPEVVRDRRTQSTPLQTEGNTAVPPQKAENAETVKPIRGELPVKETRVQPNLNEPVLDQPVRNSRKELSTEPIRQAPEQQISNDQPVRSNRGELPTEPIKQAPPQLPEISEAVVPSTQTTRERRQQPIENRTQKAQPQQRAVPQQRSAPPQRVTPQQRSNPQPRVAPSQRSAIPRVAPQQRSAPQRVAPQQRSSPQPRIAPQQRSAPSQRTAPPRMQPQQRRQLSPGL